MGGLGSRPTPTPQVYPVPWRPISALDPTVTSGLVLYWFPSGPAELKNSSLLNSRTLSLYASQCITMGVADSETPQGQKLVAGDKPPVVVLATPDGTPVVKVENKDGFLKVDQVEKAR